MKKRLSSFEVPKRVLEVGIEAIHADGKEPTVVEFGRGGQDKHLGAIKEFSMRDGQWYVDDLGPKNPKLWFASDQVLRASLHIWKDRHESHQSDFVRLCSSLGNAFTPKRKFDRLDTLGAL